MFGPKSNSLVQLERYVELRLAPRPTRGSWRLPLAFLSAASLGEAFLTATHAAPLHAWAYGIGGAALAFASYRSVPSAPMTQERQLLERADQISRAMREQAVRRRLHLVLHPGVGATLDECAGFWFRIHAASEPKLWEDPAIEAHWQEARTSWMLAADLAMAEAIVLSESSMSVRPPRRRPEEVVEDLLDTYVFTKKPSSEPLPPSFPTIRELGEKLKTLAQEVEQAQRSLSVSQAEPPIEATRRLDEVLGELRSIREAEDELQQDIRAT